MGKYQFGEPLLIDLGYYKADVFYGNGADKNYWQGTWTGRNSPLYIARTNWQNESQSRLSADGIAEWRDECI
jgi:hypothetical protein